MLPHRQAIWAERGASGATRASGNIVHPAAVNRVGGLGDGPVLAPRCGSRGGPKGPVSLKALGLLLVRTRSDPVGSRSALAANCTKRNRRPLPTVGQPDLRRAGRVLRCIIATAGVFAVLGSACAQGLPKRIWTDPPAEAVVTTPPSKDAQPWSALPDVPWPDEASRRSTSLSIPAAAPQETVAALEDQDTDPAPDADGSSLEPVPPPSASSRARRRLGPLL